MSSIFANDSSLNRNFTVAIILSVVMLLIDANSTLFKAPRTWISYLEPLIEYPAFAPGYVAEWLDVNLKSRKDLLDENARLKDQALTQQRRLQRFASLTAENIRLRDLLGSASSLSDSVLVAEIVAVDSDPFSHEVVINKGKSDHVFEGMPILDASGLMGQIVSVDQFSSRGLLISDVRHAISVELVRNNVRAIAVGTGSLDSLNLEHVANTTDIEVEDILVSSGLGGRFPRGYPVGIVTKVRRQMGRQFSDIEVKPLAKLDRSRHVLLLF